MNIKSLISSFLIFCLLFCANICFASSDHCSKDYYLGKNAGYAAGLNEGYHESKESDLASNETLICQASIPPPDYIPEKNSEYQKGYKTGWAEGYRRGYQKGSEEGNEGIVLGLLLGLFGVIIAYIM
jgi:flagellar biosynthesis/type III secretory pathway protein FliH